MWFRVNIRNLVIIIDKVEVDELSLFRRNAAIILIVELLEKLFMSLINEVWIFTEFYIHLKIVGKASLNIIVIVSIFDFTFQFHRILKTLLPRVRAILINQQEEQRENSKQRRMCCKFIINRYSCQWKVELSSPSIMEIIISIFLETFQLISNTNDALIQM